MKVISIQVGEIAVEEGYISREQLQECLKLQSLYRKPVKIGEIFLEKSLLVQEDLTRILKMQQIYITRLKNEYFLHLALKKNFFTTAQVRTLRQKYVQQESGDVTSSIAALAVANNYISSPMVEEIENSSEFQNSLKLKKEGRTVLGGFEIIGGVTKLKKAVIYKAIQVELERLVAVKTLLKEYETQEYIKRFFAEAKITARFNHPNLVAIYDTGVCENGYYYAMELVEGDNLAQKLGSEGRLQVGEAVMIIRQIAKALEHLHNQKVLHGEVNPRNIAIREDGVAKLLDLSDSISLDASSSSTGKITKMPQYMAPEQVQAGVLLDVRTDIYSLGATLYRMLTGKPPIGGKIIEEIRKNILEQEPIPIEQVDHTIPEDLAKIVHRMLRKDMNKRYRDIKNVLFALRKLLL